MVPRFHYARFSCPVSVVVLSHNRLDELRRNLPALVEDTRALGYELIVADNASRQDVQAYLNALSHGAVHVRVVLNRRNLGVAGGRNSAYALLRGEFVLSIDDDTRVSRDVLERIPSLFQDRYPRAGVIAFRVLHAQSLEDQNRYGERELLVANHHGAAAVIRREVLEQIGGIDDFCVFGSEEIDLCIRAHAAGFEIQYCPYAVAYHNNVPSGGARFLYRVQKRVFNNSRTLYKYFPLPMAARISLRYAASMVLRFALKADVGGVMTLAMAYLRGCVTGIRTRHPIPPATARYYRNENLTPTFGNTLFFRPMFRRHARKFRTRVRRFFEGEDVA